MHAECWLNFSSEIFRLSDATPYPSRVSVPNLSKDKEFFLKPLIIATFQARHIVEQIVPPEEFLNNSGESIIIGVTFFCGFYFELLRKLDVIGPP